MSLQDRCRVFRAVLLAGFFAGPAFAADRQFVGEIDPFPHEMSTRDNVIGTGTVTAVLAGDRLTIRGDFTGLSSAATGAYLRMGLAMGVPGQRIGDLTITKATSGQISGTITLNAGAIAALERNALYVELDSAKAPDGNSWAWLQAPKADMS
jgi:hypothetical protein